MNAEVWTAVTEAPLLGPKRVCFHITDYGDEATVGKQLKTRSEPERFGVFLGEQAGGFTVGVYLGISWDVYAIEQFFTRDEMHAVWILD